MAKQTAGVGKCNYEEGKRTTARGDELFSVKYLPAGEVKAVLVFHHGYGEHIGRYTKGTLKPWFAIYDARREYGRWSSRSCCETRPGSNRSHSAHEVQSPAGAQILICFRRVLGNAVFNELASGGIAVYSYDAFSFGKSQLDDHKRGHIDEFKFFVSSHPPFLTRFVDKFPSKSRESCCTRTRYRCSRVDDLDSYVSEAKAQHPNTPFFIMGHSLGGLIATYTALRNQSQYSGLILSSAAIDVKRNLALKILAPMSGATKPSTCCTLGIAAALMPMARIAPAVDPKDMSTDPEAVAAYLADPLVFSGNVRAKFAFVAKNAIEDLMPKVRQLRIMFESIVPI
eukprot:238644-Prorocentrum_minimum.AAC.2